MTPEQVEAERALFERELSSKMDVDTRYLLSVGEHNREYFNHNIQAMFEGWLAKAEQVQKPLAQSDKV